MGVALEEIIFVVILSGACEFTNIIIVTKKSKQTSMRKKFVILQSIGTKK